MEAQKLDAPLPPPMSTITRTRRRGRDVSSRYMIPQSPRSAPSSPIHPSSTPSSFRNQFHNPIPRIPSVPSSPDASDSEFEPSVRFADENQHSFITPLALGLHRKAPIAQKRRAVRLFSDNAGDTPQTHFVEHHTSRPPARAGTPRQVICSQTQLRTVKKNANHGPKLKDLTPFSGLMESSLADSGSQRCSISSLGGLCDSPPIRNQGSCRARQASELRSSVPEGDLLPASSRKPGEAVELMLRHSLNSICQPNHFNVAKTVNSKSSVLEMCSLGGVCLPPQPPSNRMGLDLKKGKKGLSRKEDVHGLTLLHNQYLQWRFVNAAANAAVKARFGTAERSLFEVSKNLEELRDSVREKRMELERLLRLRRLSNIVDAEMPYLEEWALAGGEYSDSLSGTIRALKDASIRLPLCEDVRVDIRELKESIHSATSMFASFFPSIERFSPQADGVAKGMFELAKVVSSEKALIEECGGLLSEVQTLQVNECSLRSMLMQTKRSSII